MYPPVLSSGLIRSIPQKREPGDKHDLWDKEGKDHYCTSQLFIYTCMCNNYYKINFMKQADKMYHSIQTHQSEKDMKVKEICEKIDNQVSLQGFWRC